LLLLLASLKEPHIFNYHRDCIDNRFHGCGGMGGGEWLAMRRLLIVDTNAITWMSRRLPSAETGSWLSTMGA
jgi:hypothetical protein